jgi:hypothetical protein
MPKNDWRGWGDGTPSAMPTTPDMEGDGPGPDTDDGDWKGMNDGTPSATPTTPDKEPLD